MTVNMINQKKKKRTGNNASLFGHIKTIQVRPPDPLQAYALY